MKAWEKGILRVSDNKRYFLNGDKPFFWLGDTAWLIFANISEEEAYIYLKNRADKGFNVIQACLVYATQDMTDVNKMPVRRYDVESEKYWEHCDKIISMAEKMGLYIALLPSWGSIVKNNILNMENCDKYAQFLGKRYGEAKNIIWLLGGDIKAENYIEFYEKFALSLKKNIKNQLVGFHPFGRCSTTMWFADSEWLDFNMFQSGHRRYDQSNLGAWDDNAIKEGFFGEDNWRYVLRDLSLSDKPTLDGEPSYEWILQGLHDKSQPYWVAKDVRRYAYWSVFAGACGHTYGDNSVMQFYLEDGEGVSYGAKDKWYDAIHHDGSGQMGYLKKLMESVDFINGKLRDDLLIDGQKEKYERIAVFASDDFLFAYNYLGREFDIDLSNYIGKDMWFFRPSTGVESYMGHVTKNLYHLKRFESFDGEQDYVLVIR